jgi:hypothetical protein
MTGPNDTTYTNVDGDEVEYDDLDDAEQSYYDYMDNREQSDRSCDIDTYVNNWNKAESGITINEEGEPECD